MSFSFSSAINRLVGNTPGANVADAVTCFNDLKNYVNGGIDDTNITSGGLTAASLSLTEQQRLGLNDGGQVGRGMSIISAAGTRTNAAYGALSNGPDQVASVVLPTTGLLFIRFRAYWNCSVASVGRAAIFVGANQLKNPKADQSAGVVQEASTAAGTVNNWLYTSSIGLSGTDGASVGVEGTDAVTTGVTVSGLNTGGTFNGGECAVELSAGTYTVSVQFKSSSGTVSVGGRKLWVRAEAYS